MRSAETGSKPLRNSDGHAIPLVINGQPVFSGIGARRQPIPAGGYFQGADSDQCRLALESSSAAFGTWSKTSPVERRRYLLRLVELLRQRGDEIKALIQEELYCSETWATINLQDSVGLIEEAASLVTSPSINGKIPYTSSPGSYGLVFTRPLGVVLGIAPWNSPLILGFRAVVAPIAAGNTAILKGSELSPRIHYFIANLFIDAGFPPGVLNFILHRPEDAPEVIDVLIQHPAVRKINFTGSTAVGQIIAQKAGRELKPVLLELGGKNCSLILKDADMARAAEAAIEGSTLNSGQICMATDLVIIESDVADEFKSKLHDAFQRRSGATWKLITSKGASKVQTLAADAESKGAKIWSTSANGAAAPRTSEPPQVLPLRVIEDVHAGMEFYSTESFGPLLGIVVVADEKEGLDMMNRSEYGLSSAIWSRNHHRALELARQLHVGAVHINASTVHDEATLPHGGTKSSGFGRFGGEWGLGEFLQTQTVVLHP